MTAALPDVSLSEIAAHPDALEWVGMRGIDLPLTIADAESEDRRTLHARADVQVNLPAAHVKGIHMSRLYRLLDEALGEDAVSPPCLRRLLSAMVDSHQDCSTDSARLRLSFDLLVRRPALVSEGLAGWKSYPVRIDAVLLKGVFTLLTQVSVTYSSTCPCSAALSRQLIERSFLQQFSNRASVPRSVAAAWLREHATIATPHSQRSEAVVSVRLSSNVSNLPLLALIDRVEAALATPVQTAVKRADEQAFAELNGRNLMFVEDAARRLQQALSPDFPGANIQVRHMESLHPHDAVAWARSGDLVGA
jgi:GTP cyclohydrolase I